MTPNLKFHQTPLSADEIRTDDPLFSAAHVSGSAATAADHRLRPVRVPPAASGRQERQQRAGQLPGGRARRTRLHSAGLPRRYRQTGEDAVEDAVGDDDVDGDVDGDYHEDDNDNISDISTQYSTNVLYYSLHGKHFPKFTFSNGRFSSSSALHLPLGIASPQFSLSNITDSIANLTALLTFSSIS